MQCQTPKYIAKNDVTVPCGSCAFCTATRRSDWATRLLYESKLHLDSSFVTLTYADCHLRWKNGNSQLCKRDLQLFFKRLRKAGWQFRYYACGEYGSKTFRPHYHVILFGSVPEHAIQKAWPLGHIHVGQVTPSSVMYTLGYIVNGKGWQMRHNRVMPFSLMSRKPGLGSNYLTEAMIKWHRDDRKNYVIMDGEKRHLPRFYKDKIFSKLDKVRIAVRTGNELFRKEVEWLRDPRRARMDNPIAYREEQLKRLAAKIKSKSKINLSI